MSGVTFEAGGASHTMRLGAMTMVRLEKYFDKPIHDVFASLGESPRVSTMVTVFAATLDGGKGIDAEAAAVLVDEIGFERVGSLLEEAAEIAFPQDQAKNGTGAKTGG